MNFMISGKNIEITDGLRRSVEEKLGKLERYFTPDTKIIASSAPSRSATICMCRSTLSRK